METGRESWRSDGTRGEWWCDPAGRWLLATAVLAGRAGRAAVEVHRSAVAVPLASLAGAVVLNVLNRGTQWRLPGVCPGCADLFFTGM